MILTNTDIGNAAEKGRLAFESLRIEIPGTIALVTLAPLQSVSHNDHFH